MKNHGIVIRYLLLTGDDSNFVFFLGMGSLDVGLGLLHVTWGGGLATSNIVGMAFHTSLFLFEFMNWLSSKCSAHKTQLLFRDSDVLPRRSALLEFWTHFLDLQVEIKISDYIVCIYNTIK